VPTRAPYVPSRAPYVPTRAPYVPTRAPACNRTTRWDARRVHDPGRHRAVRLASVALLPAALLLTGCTSLQQPARTAANGFYAAVSASRWGRACGYLAPETRSELEQSAGSRCPKALAAEKLSDPGPVEKLTGAGTMAQVRFREDTVFMSEFGHGWKVMAADCAPRPDKPYDCQIQG
jgi:hypothetical protein